MFDVVKIRAMQLALLVALIVTPAMSAEEKPADVAASAIAALEKSDSQLLRIVLDNGMICLIKEDHSAPWNASFTSASPASSAGPRMF
jgi:hypothetical protein